MRPAPLIAVAWKVVVAFDPTETATPGDARPAAAPVPVAGPVQVAFAKTLTVVPAGAAPTTRMLVVFPGEPGAVPASTGGSGVAARSTARTTLFQSSVRTRFPTASRSS